MKLLAEEVQIQVGIVPIDLATGANNGDWVSLKHYRHCAILIVADAGTAGEDLVLTPQQAQAVDGTGAKALNITRVDEKVGTQTGIGQFTKVTQAAAATYTNTVGGEAENLFVVEYNAEDLDVENGFDCLRITIPDSGATAGKIGCALYILSGPRYTPPPSAIVD